MESATPDRFIVDKVFAINRLHLIFGPPRSGVSTLLQQTMWDWANGREVFGGKSNPSHYCLVDAIRPLEAIRAQLRHLGYDPSEIPHVSLTDCSTHEDRTIERVLLKAKEVVPVCQVVFLDGLQALF